jgi:Domain of unknown function (DUF3458_C) ARM repeats
MGAAMASVGEGVVSLTIPRWQRMVRNFERWKRFDTKRQALMGSVLEQTAAIRGISKESAEVLRKVLA